MRDSVTSPPRPGLRARVQSFIHGGTEEAARIVAGGPGRPEGLPDGYFVRPALFADVTNDMMIAREEVFGPVLSVIAYRDDDHSVEIANDTTYGLHAYVFWSDPTRARGIVSRLEAAGVSVNGGYDPLSPFGGSSSRACGANTAPTAWRPSSSRGPSRVTALAGIRAGAEPGPTAWLGPSGLVTLTRDPHAPAPPAAAGRHHRRNRRNRRNAMDKPR